MAVLVAAVPPDSGGARAQEPIDLGGEPVPRLILALYDGRREAKVRWTRLHRYAEFVVNQLGFHMVYHDIASGMPSDTLDADYCAVLSWFDAPVPDSQAYAAWAGAVRTQDRPVEQLKFIVLAETGLSAEVANGEEGQAFLDRVGIEVRTADHHFGAWGRLAHSDPAFIGFERDFTVSDATLPLITAAAPPAVSHLRVTEPASLGGETTDLVVTAPTGAYAHGSALVRHDPNAETSLWILNPFSFFGLLLGDELLPIPDTTTLNGRRIFFSNLNGEGWTAPLPTDRPGEPVRLAGRVTLDELIGPYPDLPVSVALVTGDLDPELGGRFAEMGAEIARAAFGLPHVELSSRTRTLPLRWSFFEKYRRDVEMETVKRVGADLTRNRGVLPEAFASLTEVFAGDHSRASASRTAALRKYVDEPFDLDAEITGSLDALEALGPAERSAALMSWGGDAQVFEGALAKARLAGIAAIGGGGGIYDSVAPSVSNLTPLSLQVGAERQIYNSLGGDTVYTNFWSEPIHGLLRLQGVLDATERPRRLVPFQLSYTTYSALRFGSLNAVKTLLNRAREDFVAPIQASHYARIVEGFVTLRTFNTGPLQWRVEHRGALQTLRFDTDGEDLEFDTARCQGVLGGRREGGTFYVSLDPAEERPIVALKGPPTSNESGPGEADASFELDNARWMIRELATDSCKAAFTASGFGPGEMAWRVPRPGDYRVEMYEDAAATSSGQPFYWDNLIVQDDRMLSLALPDLNGRPARVVISSCR